MKYNILIKYVNSIPSADAENKIDIGRIHLLCEKLGRVNVGGEYIYIPGGEYAHGGALILESILCSASYPIARITDAYGFDIKRSIYLDGISPSVEDFTNVLTYIRDILKKNKDIHFLREEVVFAFCLYVCKTLGVKYIILENTREDNGQMFEVCAPYNFAIIPRLYGEADDNKLYSVSACINKVNRGVVTGNNHLYNYFSGRCHKAGIRLSIHRSVEIIEEKMRQQTFIYNKREYCLRSSSSILRDYAISILELVDMMKNHGAKIPPSAISDGVKNAGNCGCLDVISLSPMIISDISQTREHLEILGQRVKEYCQRGNLDGIFLCLEDSSLDKVGQIADVFSQYGNLSLAFVGAHNCIDEGCGHSVYPSFKKMADEIMSTERKNCLTLILGELDFTENMKNAIKAKMDRF